MPQSKVSVIIPTFNREKYIAECILSALNQTYRNIEVIISDNASTDQTWQICTELAQRDDRIVLLRNDTNLGPVQNWIRGVTHATGDYCKILFSDDCLSPTCLEEMLPPLATPDVGLVYCSAMVGETQESAKLQVYQRPASGLITPTAFTDLIINGKAPASPGAILIRTKDIRENLRSSFPTATPRAFERNGAGPDIMISLLTSEKYPHIAHINKPLVFFRMHPDSFTMSNTNNEVTKGYQSAIAYFLKHHHGQTAWIRYMAREWGREGRSKHAKPPMNEFLRSLEGQGSLSECLSLTGQIVLRPLRKLFRGEHVYTD